MSLLIQLLTGDFQILQLLGHGEERHEVENDYTCNTDEYSDNNELKRENDSDHTILEGKGEGGNDSDVGKEYNGDDEDGGSNSFLGYEGGRDYSNEVSLGDGGTKAEDIDGVGNSTLADIQYFFYTDSDVQYDKYFSDGNSDIDSYFDLPSNSDSDFGWTDYIFDSDSDYGLTDYSFDSDYSDFGYYLEDKFF